MKITEEKQALIDYAQQHKSKYFDELFCKIRIGLITSTEEIDSYNG